MGWQDDPIVSPAETSAPIFGGGDLVLGLRPTLPGPKVAKDMSDAVLAGVQSSATGLAARRALPTMALPEDAPWQQRLASNAAGIITDLPLSIVGAVGGGAAGTAAGPVGTVVGAGAGAFAAPMALRDALMTAYGQNHARSWSDVWEIAKAGLGGAVKGAVIGGATAGAGRVVGAALPVGTSVAVRGATALTAELGALTTTAAALEGHMPTWQDFMDNAILLGGLKGAVAVAGKLRANYAETGKHPNEQLADALKDPVLRAEILGDDPKTTRLEAVMTEIDALAAKHKNEPLIAQYFKDGDADRGIARIVDKYGSELSKETLDVLMPRRAKDWETGESLLAADSVRGTHIFDLREEIFQRKLNAEIPEAYRPLAIEERVKAALGEDSRPEQIRQALVEAVKDEPTSMDALLAQHPLVKMEYITDSVTAQAVTRAIEAAYRPEIEKQTRGEVPVKQTIGEAIKQITSGIDPHIVGEAESASMLAARVTLFKEATKQASATVRELALKPEAEWTTTDKLRVYAATESVEIAYQNLRGASAEVGRALNILKQLKYDPSLIPQAEVMTALMKKNSGKATFQDIAAAAAALKDPAQLARFAMELKQATTMEKFIEGWKASILSGPMTHMANMMGNAMKFAVEIPESALATTATALRRGLSGDGMGMAEFKAKAFAPLYGLKWGARDALVIAGEAFRGEGSHLEKADVYRAAIPGQAGKIIRLPFRALQAEDALFRTVAERGKAHEMAVERAVKEGFLPETREFNERVAEYTMQPDQGLSAKDGAAALLEVEKAGAEGVFAQRLGPRMEQVQAAMAGSPMQFIVPFVRTPVNLLSWAIQHSPGFLLSARWRNDFAAGGASRDRAIARVLVGSALTMTALSLVDDGLLTGGGMFDKEQRATKMAAGWQPYSIKVGDKWYSYQRLEPVAKVLGFAADMVEMTQKLKDDDRAKGWMAVMAMFGNATISTTYLSGLAGTFNALTDPTRYGEQFFEQYASSLIPKIIGQTAGMADPHKREVEGVIDAIQAQIPFLREKLMPQRDVWGEKKGAERLFGVLPVATSQESHDKVRSEAMRLELAITPVPKFLTERGPLKPGERRVDLSPEQLDVARAVSGRQAMSILAPIVNDPDWKTIPDFAKALVFQRVIEGSRVLGREAAAPVAGEQREAMRKKIVDEINRQMEGGEAPTEKRIKVGPAGERR